MLEDNGNPTSPEVYRPLKDLLDAHNTAQMERNDRLFNDIREIKEIVQGHTILIERLQGTTANAPYREHRQRLVKLEQRLEETRKTVHSAKIGLRVVSGVVVGMFAVLTWLTANFPKLKFLLGSSLDNSHKHFP